MAVIEVAKIQVRRGQENQTGVPQLDPGEFGWAQDTEHLYIGKRIVEGAADDQNSRILTENDLSNIFSLLGTATTATVNTIYQYREAVSYINTASQPRTLQSKLDDIVNLSDFGVLPSFTATDITSNLRKAVQTLFNNLTWNSFQRQDSRRKLILPVGNFLISDEIKLPPYANLEGQGPELTSLTLVNSTTNMFKTVDAEGNTFETANMQPGVKRSREVRLAGMTLQYKNGTTSSYSLVAFDNVFNGQVENVLFRTAVTSTSTTTYGLVNWGTGINIRGTGGGIGSGDTNLCENVLITDCRFDALYRGVQGTGTVVRSVIKNNVFSNLIQGVTLYTTDTKPGPSNALITENRFENVVREGIFIGENPSNVKRTNHISSDNFFIQVGNGLGLSDYTTNAQYPVIRFDSSGNNSENDFFHRKMMASTSTIGGSFYYNSLVKGRVQLLDASMTTATITPNSIVALDKIALTGDDQMVRVNYQFYNQAVSRKGTVLINVASDGTSSVTDTYNFSETLYVSTSSVSTATGSTLNIFVVDTALHPNFSSVTGNSEWYISGTDPSSPYYGLATLILSTSTVSGSLVAFNTEIISAFDFGSTTSTFSLLRQSNPSMQLYTDDTYAASNNYIVLMSSNTGMPANALLEYQIEIIT